MWLRALIFVFLIVVNVFFVPAANWARTAAGFVQFGYLPAGADLVLLDIPLLFEIGAQKELDAIVVVSAPAHIQHERVMARPGMTIEKLEALKARQVPDAKKRAQADFVVETDKGLDHAFDAVKAIVAQLRGRRTS